MTIKVDLLPTEKKGFGIDPVLIVLLLIIAAFSGLFWFYGVYLDGEIAKEKEIVAAWDRKINEVKGMLPGIQKKKDENDKLRTQIAVIKSLSNDPVRYGNILFELAYLLPQNMYVASVDVDTASHAVKLSGTVKQTGDQLPLYTLANFMETLQKNSRYYTDASLTSATYKKEDGENAYTVALETHYDPDKATQPWNTLNPGGNTGQPPGGTPTPTPTATTSPEATPTATDTASPATSPSPGAETASPATASPGAETASPAAGTSPSPATTP